MNGKLSRRTFLISIPIMAAAAENGTGRNTNQPKPAGDQPTVSTKELRYKQAPQRGLMMHLYFPPGWRKGDRRPAIVFFFGGGWQTGTQSQFAYQAEHLARRGMVAGCADYRVKKKDGVRPDACVEDAKSAVRWLRKNHGQLGIDPNRIVGGGGSAGGHLAACTGLTPDLVGEHEDRSVSSKTCALVLFNPVLDFTAEPRWMERVNIDMSLAKLISPTLHLEKGSPPAILFYGSDDPLLAQGKAFVARSEELGNRAELHVTPDQNHGFFNKSPYREETLLLADRFLTSLDILTGDPLPMPKDQG